jgi:serine/threonine-protein kinase
MAPEQWLSGPLDARTDVFALGTCLYEALTGRVVFRRETQSEVMRAVLREGVPLLSEVAPEVPAALAEITHRALSFHAEDRFQSALEMAEALDHFLALRSASLASSRVASYVRRLFRAEVELGPILERQVRGAHLASAPVLLPPLPPALLGLPKLTPSLLGLPDDDAGQDAPPALILPPLGTMSAAPQRTGATVADLPAAKAEQRLPYAEDLTESTERPLSAPPGDSQAESDAQQEPTLLPTAEQLAGAQARPLARTLSMHVRSSVRRVALLTLPAAAAMFAVMYSLLPAQIVPASMAKRTRPRLEHAAPAAQASEAPSEPPALEASEPQVLEAQAMAPDVPDTRAPKRDEKPGKLSINTRPWSTVYLGNRVLGTTPLATISVPRGTLMLKLVDRDGNVHLRRIARVKSRERSAFYDFQTTPKRWHRR